LPEKTASLAQHATVVTVSGNAQGGAGEAQNFVKMLSTRGAAIVLPTQCRHSPFCRKLENSSYA
jgi:hypothetical protein